MGARGALALFPSHLRGTGRPAGRAPLAFWVEAPAGRPAGRAPLGLVRAGCRMDLSSRVELALAGRAASKTCSLAFAFSF